MIAWRAARKRLFALEGKMKVEQMRTDALTPYANNAKIHTEKQIEQIANSIREFGFQQPIVVDKNDVVIIGHGRLEAARLLGMETVPTVKAADLTEEQAKALRLADNKLNESDYDFERLEEELAGIDIDMSAFGFEDESGDFVGESCAGSDRTEHTATKDGNIVSCPSCGFEFETL